MVVGESATHIFYNPFLCANNISIFECVLCKVDRHGWRLDLHLFYRPLDVRAHCFYSLCVMYGEVECTRRGVLLHKDWAE